MQQTTNAAQQPKVLVAEDEALIREMLVDALEEAGFEVTAVAAAEDALGFAIMDFAFDALVTDIGLDGPLDGFDLAETMREMQPDLAVIYASAASRPDRGFRQVPGSVFVPKPYNVSQLCEVVLERVRVRKSAADGLAAIGRRPELRLIA
jgi:CheY-like chemotaxis protein